MASPFDSWLKDQGGAQAVAAEPASFDEWLSADKGRPAPIIQEPAEPASFGDWLKQGNQVDTLTFGEKVKEVGKAALRMPEYVAANVGDVIGWFSERGGKGILPKYHPLSMIPEAVQKLLPVPWQELGERNQQRMIKFADNVSKYWRKAAATGIEAKDPRIEALSWLEAPILKGLTSGIESSGSFLVSVAAGIITKNPAFGLALLGTMSGGGTYKELRGKGVGEELANATALLSGTFEGLTETIPFSAIFSKTSKGFLAKFLKSATTEALQELFQNMGENYLTHFATEYTETGDVSESLKISWAQLTENWQEAISGGLVMGGAGAGMTGRAGLEGAEARPAAPPMGEEEQLSIAKSFLKDAMGFRGMDLKGTVAEGLINTIELAGPETAEQIAADEVAARLGKRTIWFKDKMGIVTFNGAIHPDMPGIVLMNANSSRSVNAVLSHEILHHLKRDAPELYDKLHNAIVESTEGYEAFSARKAMQHLSEGRRREEFMAEMFSQAAMQPGFWDKAFQAEPGLIDKLLQIIRDVLNKLSPQGQREVELESNLAPYIKDFVKLEAAAAEAAKKYAPVAKEQADIRLLRREATLKQQAGEKLTPLEEKSLRFTEPQLRDLGTAKFREGIKFSQKESVNKRVRKIASEAEGAFSDHAWTFLSSLSYEEGLADNTVAAYLTAVRDFSKFFKGNIQTVRPENLRAYKIGLSKAGKSAATINLRMSGLNEFFNYLFRTDQIAGNPMEALADELVKGEKKLPKVLSVKQMGSFVRAIREKSRKNLLERNVAMGELLWATGARATEITTIKVSDLRLSERLIMLRGKGLKERLVPLTRASVAALQAHIDKAGLGRSEYLFQTHNKDQMTRQDIGRFVKQYAKKAGLPSWVSTHTLRHTFATQLMEGGADIRFIQEMMGHSTPEITALYAHVTIKRKKEVFKKYHPSEVGILKRKARPAQAQRLLFAKKERATTRKYIVTKEGKLVRQPTVRQAAQKKVAREVGMEVEAKVVTEAEALKAKMKAQKKAADMSYKAGLAMGKQKALELKNRHKELTAWRKAFREFVKKGLPVAVQGKMFIAMENIKGEKSYVRAIERLVAEIEKTQTREARKRLEKQVKKIQKKWGRKGTFGGYRLLPEYEKILNDLMGWFTTKQELVPKDAANLNELLQWALDEQAALEAKGQTDTPFHQFEVVATIQRLQKELGAVSVAKWPAEKIDQITDALMTIVYQHLYEREAFNRDMKKRLEADITQGAADVTAAKGKPVVPTLTVGAQAEGLWEKAKAEASALLGRRNYNLSALSRIMSGMKKTGATWKRLAGNLEQGRGKSLRHRQEVHDYIHEMLKEKGITARELMSWSKVLGRSKWTGPEWVKKISELDWDAENKNFQRISTRFISVALESGKTLKVSIGEALDIYMHTRNPDNYKALTGENGVSFYGKPVQEGQKLTDADVDNITEALFKEAPLARDMVDILEKALAYQSNAVNEVSRRLLGYDLATLPGYWHIRRLMPKVPRGKKAAYTFETIEGRSHWKERVGGKQPIVIGDALNNMIETIGVGADYVGMSEPLRNAKTMIADKDFRAAAEKNGFGKYLDDISWQIGQIENPGSDKVWSDRWLAGWTRNVTRAIFGHNLRIAAQQEISVFLSFAHLDFKYAKALRPGITKDVVARIEAWSPYLRDRFGGHISREIGDIAETGGPLRFWTGKDQYANHGTYLIRHFDKRAIVNIWRMVEAEVADRAEFSHLSRAAMLKNGAYQAAVVARAEQIMRDTQPTWHKVDRSIIGSSPNMAARILTMFHSQREKMVQMAGQSNAEYANSDKSTTAKRKLARTYGMIGLNLALVNAWKMVFGVLVMRRKDEPEEWLTNVLADIPGMFYILGPPVRESVKAASRAWRGKRVYQLGTVSLPPFKVVESGREALYAWNKVAFELIEGHNVEKELLKAGDKTWEFSQYALGLPFKSVTDIAKKWSD